MKLFMFLAALWIAAATFSNHEGLSALEQRVFDLMNRGYRLSSSEIENRLENDRDATLGLLKKIAACEVTELVVRDGSRLQLPASDARLVLLRLPDPELIETVGEQLQTFTMASRYYTYNDDLFGEVVQSKQPKLLPYLAKGMFGPGDAVTLNLNLGKYRRYNRTAEFLFQLLKFTEAVEEFAPQVRGWARAMRSAHHLSAGEKREIGRIWWKENEQAILAENYAAVRPGIPAQGSLTKGLAAASLDRAELNRLSGSAPSCGTQRGAPSRHATGRGSSRPACLSPLRVSRRAGSYAVKAARRSG